MGQTFIYSFLFLCINIASSYRLNVPKVLLPHFSSVPVNFTLEISDPNSADGGMGCFTWKSSRPEIVSILSENTCSDRIIVSAISPHRQKLTAVVYAEETFSGLTLRCDVMVDVISKIEIVTTTRELFLEDAPEMFLVRAKNDQDDTFSSLDGLTFDWRLEQTEKILKFVKFSDSKYETTTAIQLLEENGQRGHRVLIEGVDTGRATLSVRLKDETYKNVDSHMISLAVVAHLMLNPSSDLYLPVGYKVRYQVQLIKQSRVEIVTMPSSQYFLSLSDNAVCSLDEASSVVTSRALGSTEISLKNKNDDLAASVRMPSAFIRVVDPNSLKFVVYPNQNWVLEVGRSYEVYLNVYDSEKHRLFIAEDMRFLVTLPKEFFEILYETKNGSYFHLKPKKRGKTELIGEFDSLKTRQNVEIFDPLVVEPNLAVFPFDPTGKTYQITLKANGGSGSVIWNSDNRRVAAVSEQAGVVVAGMDRGASTITATDLRNRLHQADMRVIVVDVTEFEIGDGPREVELGSVVRLPIFAFAEVSFSPVRRVSFANCSHLKFNVVSNDEEMFVLDDSKTEVASNGCSYVQLKAKKVGDTEVSFVLNRRDLPPLKSVVTLSVFEPLKIFDLDSDLLLAPGSSWLVKYSGGPRPWHLDASGYFASVNNEVDAVEINWPSKNSEKSLENFVIFCKDYAETDVVLSVGNKKTKSNPFPVVATRRIKLVCDAPDKIILSPVLKEHINFPSCPLLKSTHSIPIHYQLPTLLKLTAFDKSQRKFDNVSSLVPFWRSSDPSLLDVSNKMKFFDKNEVTVHEKTVIQFLVTLKPLGKFGTTTLTVEIGSFSLTNCVTQSCLKSLKNRLTASLGITLTQFPKVEPAVLAMFNHPSNKMNLHITHGSGYFYVPLSDQEKNLASISLIDNKIEIAPKNNGELILNVFDLCMYIENPAVAYISISSIAKIHLVGPELVEINKEIVVNIILLDQNDREMVGNFLHLLDLLIIADNSAVSIRLVSGRQNCTVKGLKVGVGSFVVTLSQSNEQNIRSNSHVVQVFSPLELRPKRVTLITGAKFQLQILGGPQMSGVLSFVLNDTNVANVREDGLIEAVKLGHVLITAHVTGSRGLSSQVETLGEDSILLDVVALTGIKLRLPSHSVYIGTEMNVHIVAISSFNTPMSWGSAEYPLLIEWSVDSTDVATLGFVHSLNGVTESLHNQFTRRISMLKAGLITIKVKVTAHARSKNHFAHGSKVFSDSVQLRILEPLQLISPASLHVDNSLIITPDTGVQLKLNSNGAIAHYVSHPPQLVSVDREGFLQTNQQTGQATVVVTVIGRVTERNETLSLHVSIEPIHHIQLNDISKFCLINDIHHLPVGYSIDYSISAHDSFGRPFHASNLALNFRPNRFDLTAITSDHSNRTLSVHLKHSGETVLKVWSASNKQLVDYIKISSGIALKPDRTTLTVGDFVCFESLVSEENVLDKNRRWSSSKRNVLDIQSADGVAVAMSVGESSISHSVGSKLTTKVDLNVVEPQKLEFLTWKSPKFVGAYGVDSQQSVEIPLLIKSGLNQTTNFHGEHCIERLKNINDSRPAMNDWLSQPPFSCRLSFEDESLSAYQLLSVEAKFSLESASYVCSITPLPVRDGVQHARFESALIVSIVSDGTKLSDSIRLPFYSPFFVPSNELWLDNLQNPSRVLTVVASSTQENYLKITSSMEQVVKVTKLARDAQGDRSIEYSIELLVDSTNVWQKDLSGLHLTVHSELTKQQINVPLSVKLFGQPPKGFFALSKPATLWGFLEMVTEHYGSAFLVLITVVITIAAMYFGYRAVYAGADMVPSAQLSPRSLSSGVSPSSIQWKTFAKSSPTGQQPVASSTQQHPYLWSLSRSQTPPSGSPSNYSFR